MKKIENQKKENYLLKNKKLIFKKGIKSINHIKMKSIN